MRLNLSKTSFVILAAVCGIYVLYLILFKDTRFIRVIVEKSYEKKVQSEESDQDNPYLRNYPNFPKLLYQNGGKVHYTNKSCGIMPSLSKIAFSNLYWQYLRTAEGEYQLLGAYWDGRVMNDKRPTVRILAMITAVSITEDLYCQFWFKDEVVISEKIWSLIIWHKQWNGYKHNNYKPYLISCDIPDEYLEHPPLAVSLVKNPCDEATNILRLSYIIPRVKEDVAVCVKGLDLHDGMSNRLIEWIELLKLLGASKIFFYELHFTEKIKKILRYYEETGIAEVTPITLPGHYPNEPYLQHLFLSKYKHLKRLYELLSYNDCFMKHMYEYEYIALLDIDEVIMPATGDWKSLLQNLTSAGGKPKSSYSALNVYYFDDFLPEDGYFKDIPKYMHMLQHVYRVKDMLKAGNFAKSFHNTNLALTLHNHFPIHCFGSCTSKTLRPEQAKLQHYRRDCVKDIHNCENYWEKKLMDTTIWRYKKELIKEVRKVIDLLDIRMR